MSQSDVGIVFHDDRLAVVVNGVHEGYVDVFRGKYCREGNRLIDGVLFVDIVFNALVRAERGVFFAVQKPADKRIAVFRVCGERRFLVVRPRVVAARNFLHHGVVVCVHDEFVSDGVEFCDKIDIFCKVERMDAVAVFVNDFDFVARFIGIIPPCERCKRFFNRATAVGCFADFVVYELFNRFCGRAEVYAADKEFGFVGFCEFCAFCLIRF